MPVYLCDSLRWGQTQQLWSYEGLSIRTDLEHSPVLYDTEYPSEVTDSLRFPDSVLVNASRFDRLVAELAERATRRDPGSPAPSLSNIFTRFEIRVEDRGDLEQTFSRMCDLHDAKKDHIWGYYVHNLARPVWLSRPDNRVDVIVGNPPWLAYLFMTGTQQSLFESMSRERGLWGGADVKAHQDLSALFVARCIEFFLRIGGRFGYVMPRASLEGKAYAGFRSGSYLVREEPVKIAFDGSWDLELIKPAFFRQAVGVVFGRRLKNVAAARQLDGARERWLGRFDTERASLSEAQSHITRVANEPKISLGQNSPYLSRFSQGATVVPRFLFMVTPDDAGPLGVGAGRRAVVSRRGATEKSPWRSLPSLHGIIERKFVRSLYLGETILPFRCRQPSEAVIPWDRHLLSGSEIDGYPGLAAWWRQAETVWRRNRSSDRLELSDQLDYRRKLSRQFPASHYRVVFSASGMYLAAAIVSDSAAIIEHILYWGAAESLDEARFLTAALNSNVITMAVRHLQIRGEYNPRHFDKSVFKLPIPAFNPGDPAHQHLVSLAGRAELVAAAVSLPAKRFETQRRCVREALERDGVMAEIDAIVKTFIA